MTSSFALAWLQVDPAFARPLSRTSGSGVLRREEADHGVHPAGNARHNASLQVFSEGERSSRVVWIADLLPNDLAGPIAGLIDQGMAIMRKTLEARAAI